MSSNSHINVNMPKHVPVLLLLLFLLIIPYIPSNPHLSLPFTLSPTLSCHRSWHLSCLRTPTCQKQHTLFIILAIVPAILMLPLHVCTFFCSIPLHDVSLLIIMKTAACMFCLITLIYDKKFHSPEYKHTKGMHEITETTLLNLHKDHPMKTQCA